MGWKRLQQLAKDQANQRVGKVLYGTNSALVDVVNREYERGEVAGIQFFAAIPEVEIARLEHELQVRKTRNGQKLEENDDETTYATERPAP